MKLHEGGRGWLSPVEIVNRPGSQARRNRRISDLKSETWGNRLAPPKGNRMSFDALRSLRMTHRSILEDEMVCRFMCRLAALFAAGHDGGVEALAEAGGEHVNLVGTIDLNGFPGGA